MQALCERSPAFAQFLIEEIPKHLDECGETHDDSKVQESGIASTQSRKKRKRVDLSYRPPKSKVSLDNNVVEDPGEVVERDTTAMGCRRLPNGHAGHVPTSPEVTAQTPVLDLEGGVDVEETGSPTNTTCHFEDQISSLHATEIETVPSTNPDAAHVDEGPSIQGRSATVNENEQLDVSAGP